MVADSRAASVEPDLEPGTVSGLLAAGLEVCTTWKRPDLATKLRLAQARLDRPATLVCVVGEYKQGKSLLINALVGSATCPVDDDLATAVITAVYGSAVPEAKIRRSVDGRPQVDVVPIDQLVRYVTESGRPDDRAGIELVEVGIPSPVLENGLTLVDTPGAGGILRQHTETTLRFLGLADAVLFVTDASQELTASEVAFLEQAAQVCPTVLVALSKVDLYPEWERILQKDRDHLADRGVTVEPLPVSAALKMEGVLRDDPSLDEESGIRELLATLQDRVVQGAKQKSAVRAVGELRWTLRRLLEPIETELAILDDPESAQQELERLRAMQERLKGLQEAGARWSTLLNDGFTDLRSEVDYRLRTVVRALMTKIDELLEQLDPASEWNTFSQQVQRDLSAAVADTFTTIHAGANSIAGRIAALLADGDEGVPALPDVAELDVSELWSSADREPKGAKGSSITGVLSSGLTALRGASSGMILLGMVGNLAGIALAGPISLGVAAFFGTKQVVDTRKSALKQRRQEARNLVRQYVDEVNLEAGNRTRQLVQDLHRTLRDHYAGRLQELSRSAAGALQAAQESLAADQAGRTQRAGQLREWAARLRRQLDQLPESTVPS